VRARKDEVAWAAEHEAEVAILHAVLTELALRSKVDEQTFSRVPSLDDFVAMANTVAKEIGRRDEPRTEVRVSDEERLRRHHLSRLFTSP
jgi:hypothetical protein